MIGFIGGSGVYNLDDLESVVEKKMDTPFGDPSDVFVCGRLGEREACFLPRHGRGHRVLPSEINHRANVYGFKCLGVERLISISAVGSLREELRPRDIVLPDQYFDRTKKSAEHTFFGRGIVAHVSFAQPGCPALRDTIQRIATQTVAAQKKDICVKTGGTYVNIEGPAFSTKAESNVYRQLGFDIIGMTSLGEAKLCKEAEICYQAIAMVTDYDCWHESEEDVTVDMVIEHLRANTDIAKTIIRTLASDLPDHAQCGCQQSLAGAMFTDATAMPPDIRQDLKPIIEKYIS
jgi:5'-methylthioadenosine phosphorylase